MSNIRFTSSMVNRGSNKGLKPDANGYYTMIIGGLNVFNSNGEFYTLKGAKDLFESSSALMRRVKNGSLKGELGHPKFDPGTTVDWFVNRCMEIRETNICAHFSEIWLDYDIVKGTGQNTVAIVAKVAPSGPHAETLERSLSNDNDNSAFSIRAFTDDYKLAGVTNRELKTIVTWDFVTEPGISIANKNTTMNSMGMESLLDKRVDIRSINKIAQARHNGISHESSIIANEIIEQLGYSLPEDAKASFTKW